MSAIYCIKIKCIILYLKCVLSQSPELLLSICGSIFYGLSHLGSNSLVRYFRVHSGGRLLKTISNKHWKKSSESFWLHNWIEFCSNSKFESIGWFLLPKVPQLL